MLLLLLFIIEGDDDRLTGGVIVLTPTDGGEGAKTGCLGGPRHDGDGRLASSSAEERVVEGAAQDRGRQVGQQRQALQGGRAMPKAIFARAKAESNAFLQTVS